MSAQEVSFYDQNWNITAKENAQFYFVTIDHYPYVRLNTLVKYSKDLDKYEEKFSKKIVEEVGKKEIEEISFLDSDYDSIYIGKKVKIFFAAGIYDYLCESSTDSIDWPSLDMKNRSGVCYGKWKGIREGAIGRIMWKFNNFKSSTNEAVFLLMIDNYYVPIRGSSLTLCDKYSMSEIPKKKESFFFRLFHKKKEKIDQF